MSSDLSISAGTDSVELVNDRCEERVRYPCGRSRRHRSVFLCSSDFLLLFCQRMTWEINGKQIANKLFLKRCWVNFYFKATSEMSWKEGRAVCWRLWCSGCRTCSVRLGLWVRGGLEVKKHFWYNVTNRGLFSKSLCVARTHDRPLELNTERNSAIPIRDPFDSWIVALIYYFGIFWIGGFKKRNWVPFI